VTTASLALPIELQRQETLAAYNDWLESRVLGPLRAMSPECYRAIVDSIRTLIVDSQGALMKKDDPDYQRHRVLLAYTKLSTPLRSDVFSDGSIAARFALPMNRPLRLLDNLVTSNETLFAAFRCAVEGKPITALIDENNIEIAAKVSIAVDGTGIVEIGDRGWRFAHAALLSGDKDRRLATLESALCRHTIAVRYAAELRALVAKGDYSDEDFVETVRLLSSSPEAFAGRLRDIIAKREIGEADLLPDDIRYWDHLLPWGSRPHWLNSSSTNSKQNDVRACRIILSRRSNPFL
jgi:hypothetical protein